MPDGGHKRVEKPGVEGAGLEAPTGAPERRSQGERSAGTRRRLIDAALEVMRQSGYASLTISKVTQRAGVTNGAMQYHFRSRDDLLLAVLDAVYPVLLIPFGGLTAEGLDVRERMSRLVDMLWAIYSRPEYLVAWDIALGARGDARLWARVQTYQQDILARSLTQFVSLFADLKVAPEDAEHVLLLTVSYMRGVAFQSLFDADQLRAADFAVIKDVAYQQLMKCATVP